MKNDQATIERAEDCGEIVRRLADGVVVVDDKGIITFANPAAGKMFGFDSAELIGKPFGFPLAETAAARVRIISRGKQGVEAEMRVSRLGEREKRYIVSMRDISGIIEEEKLKIRLEKASRLSDIGTLAATVAHELRNPLAAIKVAAFSIKRRTAARLPVDHQVATINEKVGEGEEIISDLLSYTRLRQPSWETVDIGRLIDETVGLTSDRIDQKQVRVIKEFKSLEGVNIRADSLQLRQVFQNVLNNAFDAVEEKQGVVAITGKRDDGSVEIAVKDNGSGIEKEDLKRLFEPFFSTKPKGTGLGLAVSKQIVNMHHGDIRIESEKGKGTTVFIRLSIESDENSVHRAGTKQG
ncbi:MAG: sensor histidine kinase [Deltaproteobacteria bacterium]